MSTPPTQPNGPAVPTPSVPRPPSNGFAPPGPPPAGPPQFASQPPAAANLATQHLSAAAYIDRNFRNAVLDEVYHRPDRAVAPNPGTDAVPVLQHMRKARKIDLVQQSVLAGMLLFLLCAPVVSRLGLLIGLVFWAMVGIPVLLAESRSRVPTGSVSVGSVVKVNWRPIVVVAIALAVTLVFFLVFLPMMAADMLLGAPDSAGGFAAGEGGSTGGAYVDVGDVPASGPGPASAIVWLLLLAAVPAIGGGVRAASLMSVPVGLDPSEPVDERTRFIGMAQHSPVVTYNANRTPFVGSGFPLATWQFALTLHPADASDDGGSPMTIDPVSLNRSVRSRLERLGADSSITRHLPGLELGDHVYVSGRDTVGPVFHAHELPRSNYRFASVEEIQTDPTTPVRHYLRCTIDSWGGELVTTVFLHCALQGESLYVEFTSCVLPPTPERYHVFGRVSKEFAVFLGVVRGIAAMPIELLRSPIDVFREIGRAVAGSAGGGVKPGTVDHGAVAGVRELGTGIAEHNYFQYRDSIKYIEILERQVLDALLDYLRENNVDISELDERANTIVNNGVINYGKMQTAAAGAGSSAKVGAVGDASRGTVSGGK